MSKNIRQRVTASTPKAGVEIHPFEQMITAVQEAEKLRLAGKLDRARSACGAVLKQDPDYVAALFTMGLILADQSKYEKALGYLHRAAMFNPYDPKILTGLSGVYLKLDSSLMAARTLEQARQFAPEDANILATLGEIYREEKEYELSKSAFETALEIDPMFTAAEIGLALNLTQIGHLSEAGAIFENKVREGSRSLAYLYHLCQLPASLVDLDLISLLDETKRGPRQTVEDFREQLAFTKSAALDKAEQHEEAWTELCKANRYKSVEHRRKYKKSRERHAPLLDLAKTSKLDRQFDDAASAEAPLSLFIVGPSRSGKTSLERLAGSLRGVKKGYENPIVENAVRRAFQTAGYPTRSLLVQLPPGLSELFREFYLEELERRANSAKVLTNTLPQRTEDALRAATEIPNARFVFIKRDIDDLTIRIFMRNYASGNHYASDLQDIRDYLQWCHDMIDVAADRMPDISRVITYEEMVVDPTAALAEVAELCDLEMSGTALLSIGDDRGCAQPYRHHIEAALPT